MSEWRECKLGDITTVIGDGLHGTPLYDDQGEFFFINGNNLNQGKIIIKPDTNKVTKQEYIKYKKPLSDKTILLSINGTIGNLALYYNEKCMLGKSACYINVNDNVDRAFMYYVFTNNDFQNFLIETATGTTIPNVPLKGLREYTFNYPPLPEQKAIAGVLSSLDDKIDLLHRQNKTLEAMAEALFRQWFVEGADEGWEEGKLGDIVDFNYGIALKEEKRSGNGYPVVGSSGIVGFHNEFYVKSPGIVTGRKGTLGVINYMFDNFTPIDTSFYITSKTSSDLLLFEYFLLRNCDLENMNSDSAVPGLNRNAAHSIFISIPPQELIIMFNDAIKPFFEKIKENQSQIRTLEKLRDGLLPKLMSGEVRIKGV